MSKNNKNKDDAVKVREYVGYGCKSQITHGRGEFQLWDAMMGRMKRDAEREAEASKPKRSKRKKITDPEVLEEMDNTNRQDKIRKEKKKVFNDGRR